MIYLDHAASTPADPAVLAAFLEAERAYPGNPNANHPAGRAAREKLDQVTERLAAALGVGPEEILYPSGATQANLWAIQGIAWGSRSLGRHILTTPLDHPSVEEVLADLAGWGYTVEEVPVDGAGVLRLDRLKELLWPDTVLLTLPAVDSELGAVQPLAQVRELLADFPHCRLHVDATQGAGKVPLSPAWVDTMSIAPHKLGGLKGIGLLVKRRGLDLPLPPHEGTPALSLAAAAEKALSLALDRQRGGEAEVRAMNRRLREALGAYPGVTINSPEEGVPHILNLSVQGVLGTAFQRALGEKGICVSVRSACAQDGQPSRAVLAATGDRRRALSAWRIGLSHRTTQEELTAFLQAFDACHRALCPPR